MSEINANLDVVPVNKTPDGRMDLQVAPTSIVRGSKPRRDSCHNISTAIQQREILAYEREKGYSFPGEAELVIA